MKIYYARVSSVSQNLDRQTAEMPQDIDLVYEEKVSGKDMNRPRLNAMLETVRAGDEVFCLSLDRLGRNVQDLLSIVQTITDKGATITFQKEHLTFHPQSENPINSMMFTILGAIAAFERSLIKERQREGIKIAKEKGKFKGCQRKLSSEKIEELKEMYLNGVPVAQIARQFKLKSRSTVYAYVKEFQDQRRANKRQGA